MLCAADALIGTPKTRVEDKLSAFHDANAQGMVRLSEGPRKNRLKQSERRMEYKIEGGALQTHGDGETAAQGHQIAGTPTKVRDRRCAPPTRGEARGYQNAKISTYLPSLFSEPSGTPPSLFDSVGITQCQIIFFQMNSRRGVFLCTCFEYSALSPELSTNFDQTKLLQA
jgi:hypothetical protein